LSSRGDLVGLDTIKQLQYLQDTIPHTFTTDEAKAIILEDLGHGYLEDIIEVDVRSLKNVTSRRSGPDSAEPTAKRLKELLESLSDLPVASASLGQVYRARVDGKDVAVKIQRPRLREEIAADFLVARWGASILSKTGLLRSDGVGAVDEYASRLFEELDYRNEAMNLERFASLYAENGTAASTLPHPGVVVPTLIPDLCSQRVLTMTWLEGEKLIGKNATVSAADLPLVQLGIECTLSQLLETGVLHADPHGGNLLKVTTTVLYDLICPKFN
jgi:predicted unusual protein kinase regulating ubiquinone biosynthesis (AarF/ABC1/UbiB family)